MRVVVWNCNGKLRHKKLQALEDLQPDVAIVVQCESPEKLWGKQPLLAPVPMEWIGDDENRGLAVLAFNGYRVARHASCDPSLRWLLPVEVRGPNSFRLLAVWAAELRIPKTNYEELCGPALEMVDRYGPFLSSGPAIVAGDFCNNVRWDRGNKATNHGRTVAGLERINLASAYHVGRGELHGKESAATSFGQNQKPVGSVHHVDYCYLPLEWCSSLRDVQIGSFDDWVGRDLSNHVPLVVDVDLGQKPSNSKKPIRTDL